MLTFWKILMLILACSGSVCWISNIIPLLFNGIYTLLMFELMSSIWVFTLEPMGKYWRIYMIYIYVLHLVLKSSDHDRAKNPKGRVLIITGSIFKWHVTTFTSETIFMLIMVWISQIPTLLPLEKLTHDHNQNLDKFRTLWKPVYSLLQRIWFVCSSHETKGWFFHLYVLYAYLNFSFTNRCCRSVGEWRFGVGFYSFVCLSLLLLLLMCVCWGCLKCFHKFPHDCMKWRLRLFGGGQTICPILQCNIWLW